MLNVKLFRAEIDLVNLTMLLPIVEIGAEAGPVALLFKGTSKVRPVDSLVKSGEEQGDEELGEPDGEAIVEEEEEEDIVGEVELASLSLGSIFGDIAGDDVEDEVGGGTEGSNSAMVARLFLMRPMFLLGQSDVMQALSTAALPGFSLSHFFSTVSPGEQLGENQLPANWQFCATNISGSLLTPISHDTSCKTWSHGSVVSMEFPATRAAVNRRLLPG